MLIKITNPFKDKATDKLIAKDTIFETSDERAKTIINFNCARKLTDLEIKELSKDEVINLEEFIPLFLEDRTIVNDLRSDDLKIVCEHYEIEYINVSTTKKDLIDLEIKE